MHEAGYKLGNVDATIILQRPKLSPHKETIRANLCRLLDADPSVVNIKVPLILLSLPFQPCQCREDCRVPDGNLLGQAKTHEKVDSLGENRSIAVHAVIMLIREDLY